MARARIPAPDWFAFVRPGDVLKMPSGTLRVVRAVRRRKNGSLYAIDFVAKRRGRYRAAVVGYFATELKSWSYVGARVKLPSPLDRRIAEEIEAIALDPRTRLQYDDVRGLP